LLPSLLIEWTVADGKSPVITGDIPAYFNCSKRYNNVGCSKEIRMKPKISIAILNHNGRDFLEKTVPPLLEQDYPNYEIVVVDNNSSDDSIEYLEKLSQVESKIDIQIVENDINYGYSKGKNMCVDNSEGEYILLLDEDILYHSETILERLINEYNKKDNIAFLSNALVNINEKKTKLYGGFFEIYSNKQLKPLPLYKIRGRHLTKIGSHNGGAVFFKKSIWYDIGGYDESQPYNIGDFDLGPRAWVLGYENYLFSEYIPSHLGVADRRSDDIWKWKYKYYFSGRARMMIKNYRMKNLIKSFPLLVIFTTLKTIKQTWDKKDMEVPKMFFISIFLFILNLQDTMNKRKKIQQGRENREDVFLNV